MRHRLLRDWLLLSAAAAVLVLVPALLVDFFSYNRWDNFEYFTPILREVHMHILAGRIPRMNFHQHMGEPLMANSQAGPFYPFYTIAVGIVEGLGLPAEHLMTAIMALHMPFALAGLFFLMRHIGIRAWLSFLLAVSGASSGYLLAYSITWIFVFPVFTWIAWSVLGMLWIIEGGRPLTGHALLVCGMALIALIGHGQMMVYAWLYLGLLGLAIAHYHGGRARKVFELLPAALVAALLAAPAILPSFLFISETARSAAVSLAVFQEGAARPQSVFGLISPLFRIWGGFLTAESTFAMYQGVHVFVFLAFTAWLRLTGVRSSPAADTGVRLPLAAVLVPTLVMVMFALGAHLFVYRLTYGVPVWSSFRWPHKFLLLVNWGLLISAGLLAERYVRLVGQQRVRLIALSLSVLAVLLAGLILVPSRLLWEISGLMILCTSVAIAVVLPWTDSRLGQLALAGLGLVSAVGMIALCHDLDLKTYRESVGTYSPERLGIDASYRVIPIHRDSRHPPRMYQLNLFHAATANGYWSLTGTAHPLIPLTYSRVIETYVDGRIPDERLERLLSSHLLRSWNVRYAVVGRSDEAGHQLLDATGFQKLTELDAADVYESSTHLPRIYFADRVVPDSEDSFEHGLMERNFSLRTVVRRDADEPRRYPDTGRVLRSHWDAGGTVLIDVDVPESGFLVVSLLHSTGWRATVDGESVAVHQVNRSIMGIELPAAASSVVFSYRVRGLALAWLLAAAGTLLGCVLLWLIHQRARNAAGHDLRAGRRPSDRHR